MDIPFVTVGSGIGSFVTVDYSADRRRADVADAGPRHARPPLADLRVPDPGLADPPRRAAPLRLGLASGQHLGLPVVRLQRRCAELRSQGSLGPVHRADLRRLLHAEGRPGLRDDGAGEEPDRLRRDAGQGPGPDRAPAVRRRLLHDPHPARGRGRHQAGRLPLAVRPPRRRLPRPEVPARAPALPDRAQRLPPHRQRLRGARARLRAPHAAARAPSWCAAAASWPPGCSSG